MCLSLIVLFLVTTITLKTSVVEFVYELGGVHTILGSYRNAGTGMLLFFFFFELQQKCFFIFSSSKFDLTFWQ